MSPEDQHKYALRDHDAGVSRVSKAFYSSLDRLDGMESEKVTGTRCQIIH